MKQVYLKAIIISLAVGSLLFYLIYRYVINTYAPTESYKTLYSIEKMETEGIPLFVTNSFNGEPFNMAQYKGKAVILNFWASWCGPCLEEVPSLISLVDAMKGDLHLVAVSGDSDKKEIEQFLKAFPGFLHPNITIIWDEKSDLMNQYNVQRLPESFVVNSDLKLAKKIVGSIQWHTKDSEQYIRSLIKK